VTLDPVAALLAKLRRLHVISGRQMAHLMNNYVIKRDCAERRV
jgi:hypothetical protein